VSPKGKSRAQRAVPKDLAQLGFRPDLMKTLKLGRGAIGKASWVMGVLLAVLLVVALRMPDAQLIYVLLVLACLGAAYLFYSAWVVKTQPGVAMLEGAELIQWEQLQSDAAKNELPPLKPTIDIFDPTRPQVPELEQALLDEEEGEALKLPSPAANEKGGPK
jgi:hypothetical protein